MKGGIVQMTDIIMVGCNGRMGQMISGLVKEDADCRIVAGIDIVDNVYRY